MTDPAGFGYQDFTPNTVLNGTVWWAKMIEKEVWIRFKVSTSTGVSEFPDINLSKWPSYKSNNYLLQAYYETLIFERKFEPYTTPLAEQ
jgi:hypothetical protein